MMATAATAGGPLLAGSRRCPAADRPVGRHTTIRRGGNGHAETTALPGFCFEEADAGSPYQPAMLAGPLDSIIAVRQVNPAVRSLGDADRARAARNGQRAAHETRLPVRAGRRVAEG
jgi:hypothetical protein